MSRNLMTAIAAGSAQVDLVSEFQIRDGKGRPDEQARLQGLADVEAARLIQTLGQTDTRLWVTYHNYYKSPDLLGPTVTKALGIPYIQIETSRAKSRLNGPWSAFAAKAEAASDAADLIFYVIQHDKPVLQRDRSKHQRLALLRPFLPIKTLPQRTHKLDGPMLSAGMMRARDKLASYAVVAETLALLNTTDWQLDIAGDGPARPQVEALMAPFGNRVRFLGQLDRSEMTAAYDSASLFFWPGVNEAYGMVYLEAQAAGLPVVAQDRDGVRDVVVPGYGPSPDEGPQALATDIDHLLANPDERILRGQAARAMIAKNHLIDAATHNFWTAARPLLDIKS